MLHATSRLRVALTLLLTTMALPAAAAHLEVQGGRSYMDDHGANAAFVEATFAAHPTGIAQLDWSPDISAGWIDSRDVTRYRGAEFDARDPVALLAAGARFHYGAPDAWYRPLFFSFQLAGINHTTQALSSHYQFVSTLGWQGEHLSFQLRHVSNGGINGPNRGETMALVGVGFDL
ncbi:acyloxyacyl hydrolase [Frateuria hangzhouensis]|uniref:acyloxyacyl hydrolase n=1 Tax=Frateuria hangzhouensis TaxID=2995589 RepID=UPI002260A5C1|nr:acyloxyacyl hydrolase [Frateuria sp. STR12]MCX7513294.1 acyloxyacyl hydrolase [Frateuria sp. STR12]